MFKAKRLGGLDAEHLGGEVVAQLVEDDESDEHAHEGEYGVGDGVNHAGHPGEFGVWRLEVGVIRRSSIVYEISVAMVHALAFTQSSVNPRAQVSARRISSRVGWARPW